MVLFYESRLIYIELCLLLWRGKLEWVLIFVIYCINVNIVKVWIDEWSLVYLFIFFIDMMGLMFIFCMFLDFYCEKRGECLWFFGGWLVKLNC